MYAWLVYKKLDYKNIFVNKFRKKSLCSLLQVQLQLNED